jgi:hypothetical protein
VVFSLGNGFCAVASEFCTSHIGVTRDGSMSIGAMRTSAAKKNDDPIYLRIFAMSCASI